MSLPDRALALRQRVLKPWLFKPFLWARLPLAAFAGLRVVSLDEASCTVRLPGGWRTRNPFGSAYFAAQAMAAEMSTGAPALVLASAAPVSIAFIVRELRAVYTKRVVGESFFTFPDVASMQAAIERAGASGEPTVFVARSTGRLADDTIVSEFDATWSFKRRG
jgi:hypothetical protein